MFPEFPRESLREYRDPALPFAIQYRPDLYDPLTKTVYDIKSQKWVIQNLRYCVAQISGYVSFLGAKHAVFLVYRNSYLGNGKRITEGPWPWTTPYLVSWDHLRRVAMESYKLLIEGGS